VTAPARLRTERLTRSFGSLLAVDAVDFEVPPGWLRPENRDDFLRTLQGFRRVTMEDLKRNERLCWGAPADVRDALIGLADALGAGTLLLQFNQGAMPHEMFVNQIRRFAAEILPAARRHTVTKLEIG